MITINRKPYKIVKFYKGIYEVAKHLLPIEFYGKDPKANIFYFDIYQDPDEGYKIKWDKNKIHTNTYLGMNEISEIENKIIDKFKNE